MVIIAKFPGKCRICGRKIHAGTSIEWEKGQGARHADCTGAPVALNSRPPEDTTGPIDPVAVAAKYGRVAVEPVQLLSFTFQLHRGKHRVEIGSVQIIRGNPVLVAGRSQPEKITQDDCDDNDWFDRRPGIYYTIQAIPVVRTPEEQAKHDAEVAAKALIVATTQRFDEIERLVLDRGVDGHRPPNSKDFYGWQGTAGHHVLFSDGVGIVGVCTSSYDDAGFTRVLHDADLAVEISKLIPQVKQNS